MTPDHNTIVRPKPTPPSRSWWVGKDRQTFREQANAEAARMNAAGFVLYNKTPKAKKASDAD